MNDRMKWKNISPENLYCNGEEKPLHTFGRSGGLFWAVIGWGCINVLTFRPLWRETSRSHWGGPSFFFFIITLSSWVLYYFQVPGAAGRKRIVNKWMKMTRVLSKLHAQPFINESFCLVPSVPNIWHVHAAKIKKLPRKERKINNKTQQWLHSKFYAGINTTLEEAVATQPASYLESTSCF